MVYNYCMEHIYLYDVIYVTVNEKRGLSTQKLNFKLAVPADSAKPALL